MPAVAREGRERTRLLRFGGSRVPGEGQEGRDNAGRCCAHRLTGAQRVVSSWEMHGWQEKPRGTGVPGHLRQRAAGTELLSLEGNTGNSLSSSDFPSEAQASHRWRRKEREGHPSQNPFPSRSTRMTVANPCGDGRSYILSGLQMNEGLGGPLRTWGWMVIDVSGVRARTHAHTHTRSFSSNGVAG